MNLSKRIVLLISTILFSLSSIFGQGLIQNKKFTYVSTFDNKVVFVKEIPLVNPNMDSNYFNLKEWGKRNYATDIMISGIRYDDKNKEIITKSRVDLIFPKNSLNVEERITMSYRLNAFIMNKMCILEIKDISYNYRNETDEQDIRLNSKAENMITNEALLIKDNFHQLRVNTKIGTLYFLNELADDLVQVLNHQ